jgi:hypothetical protein
MSDNHWTVFNGAGAVVADNMSVEVVRAYLTPERFARGWMAAYTLVVRTPDELAAIEPSEDPHTYGEDCTECKGYCLRFPSWSKNVKDVPSRSSADTARPKPNEQDPLTLLHKLSKDIGEEL